MSSRQGMAVANVVAAVERNLQDQHDWTQTKIHDTATAGSRALIRGLPPRLLYMHPDDQIAALQQEHQGLGRGEQARRDPELEWVLPIHLSEKWSLASFAAVFDSIKEAGPRGKRIVLGILHNDSTVVYYLMHEGMVKPRQN
ncbi:hypothetical protein S40288_00196 [Stachybotrys chartarum IBT 40288]|nr:hypothetical protein S40288_00196 [Stachybotrys chartarum IBT 40288]